MDYKEKYNKLVKAVKVLQEANPSDDGIQNWVNDNVPELRESKDERIKNTLIRFHKSTIDIDGIKGDEIVSWLEKQGRKPAWSEEDENGLGDALWCCKQAASIAKDENDMGNAWYAEHWLKSLRYRSRWKPSEEQMKALDAVIDAYDGYPEFDLFVSLKNDLKKL